MTKKQKYAFKKLLSVREFRAHLWRIIQACQTFNHGFVPGDPHASSYTEGQRSIGLMILSEVLDADPKAFLQMREEWFEDCREAQKKESAQGGNLI